MAVLPVLRFPDERLRTKAATVELVDDSIRAIVDDMFDTMYDEKGVGLAATQVNIHKRIVVMDVSENADQPRVFINPEIIKKAMRPLLTKRVVYLFRAATQKSLVTKQLRLKHLTATAMNLP